MGSEYSAARVQWGRSRMGSQQSGAKVQWCQSTVGYYTAKKLVGWSTTIVNKKSLTFYVWWRHFNTVTKKWTTAHQTARPGMGEEPVHWAAVVLAPLDCCPQQRDSATSHQTRLYRHNQPFFVLVFCCWNIAAMPLWLLEWYFQQTDSARSHQTRLHRHNQPFFSFFFKYNNNNNR